MKKFTLPKEVELFFIALRRKIRRRYDNFTYEAPVVKEECITKIVHGLRRDFPIEVQNEIVLAVSKNLNDLREKDQVRMEEELETLKVHSAIFKTKVLC